MDFTQRSNNPAPAGGPAPHASVGKSKGNKKWVKVVQWSSLVMLFSVGILLIAIATSIAFSKSHNESKYVDHTKLQAVFLNGGQVYFGNITSLNHDYIAMSNIYYLRVNQTVQPNQSTTTTNANDVSLVKLGCELHGPTDQMVLNNSQVIFWENLKTDGQVAKAVVQYQKDNPKGQTCTTAASTGTTTAPAATTPATTTTRP